MDYELFSVEWRDQDGFPQRTRKLTKKEAVKVRDVLNEKHVPCRVYRVVVNAPDEPTTSFPRF